MDNLTRGQTNILLNMVRREARILGYEKEWHWYNRPKWPRRLKQLEIIAGKLNQSLGNQ